MWIQKYAKSVVIKQHGQLSLLTPIHLQEASGALAFTLYQGGWITVHKRRFFLKERRSAVYKTLPAFTEIGLQFVLRHSGGVDLTVTERFL